MDEDLVFLDTATDTYACMPQAAAQATLHADARTLTFQDDTAPAGFLQAGLLVAGPATDGLPSGCVLAPARTSAIRTGYPLPGLQHAPEALLALAELARYYRGRSFAQILQRIEHRRPPVDEAPTPGLLSVVDRFHRWVPYAPVSGKCLLRAFMLLRVLARAGYSAHWVFGVATWPFRAHCWLQCGDVVLDDEPERVAAFAPILIL